MGAGGAAKPGAINSQRRKVVERGTLDTPDTAEDYAISQIQNIRVLHASVTKCKSLNVGVKKEGGWEPVAPPSPVPSTASVVRSLNAALSTLRTPTVPKQHLSRQNVA
jgi:hypothetical protein